MRRETRDAVGSRTTVSAGTVVVGDCGDGAAAPSICSAYLINASLVSTGGGAAIVAAAVASSAWLAPATDSAAAGAAVPAAAPRLVAAFGASAAASRRRVPRGRGLNADGRTGVFVAAKRTIDRGNSNREDCYCRGDTGERCDTCVDETATTSRLPRVRRRQLWFGGCSNSASAAASAVSLALSTTGAISPSAARTRANDSTDAITSGRLDAAARSVWIELVVEVGAGQLGVDGQFFVVHGALLGRSGSVHWFPSSAGPACGDNALASAALPRAILLFTVPAGMSSTSAISA